MSTKLTVVATEKSTYIVTAAFEDENDAPVVPNTGTVKWSLYTQEWSIVNGREQVAIPSATTIAIVLSGADLDVTPPMNKERVVLVECTYNSTAGNNLPLRETATFEIEQLPG